MEFLRKVADVIGLRSALPLKGPYGSWAEARAASTGYDDRRILETVAASTRKVIAGERPYERDGVCFDEVHHHWALLASLQRIALAEGTLNVLDFGGGLGSTYNYVSRLWPGPLRWSIVEQPHFAEAGSAAWAGHAGPQFFHSFDDCLKTSVPNACLLSGVLQYLEDPWTLVKQIVASGIKWVLVDRVPVVDGDRKSTRLNSSHIQKSRMPSSA